MVKSEIPPSLSCHKSCLAAQNKLLLETSLLALYPLPFITSKELQKAKKKKKEKKKSPQATHVTSGPTPPTLAKMHSSPGDIQCLPPVQSFLFIATVAFWRI